MPPSQIASDVECAVFRQSRFLESYRFSLPRGRANVRQMIFQDIARFSDLGAYRLVADLHEVLDQFDLNHTLRGALA
jgi:hypothetical protein